MDIETIKQANCYLKMIKELGNALEQLDEISSDEITGFTVTFRTNKKDDNDNIIYKRFSINGKKLTNLFKETSTIWLKDNFVQTNINLEEL